MVRGNGRKWLEHVRQKERRRDCSVPEIGIVDTTQRLRHSIEFHDSTTPTKRGKPAGIMGCEIWSKIGDPAECQFIALDTASPYVIEYPGAQAGQKAHYMLRWVMQSGEKGPWSETLSATIGG